MALEDEQHQQQPKRMEASPNSSGTSEILQSIHTLLPVEIFVAILRRLPVESLLRSKSVCKKWYSILSHPHFINSHRLIFSTRATSSMKSCPLYDVISDGGSVNNALELDCPLKHHHTFVSIIGSCNGLLLVSKNDDVLFIWNPFTRRSERVPSFGSERRSLCGVYGFGYDESTDDYKVVNRSGGPDATIVNIYSLKTGNWKRIGDFHNGFPWNNDVKYLNGALHWIVSRKSGSSYSWTIISLDLAKETYGEILQPVYDEGHTNLKLGVLGEWLCVLCDYRKDRADVWVMKVYGVKDSWTKLVSIPYLAGIGLGQFSVPLTVLNDGKVLLHFRLKLVVYDPKSCSFSEIQNFDECFKAFTFVESLVSPAGARLRQQ